TGLCAAGLNTSSTAIGQRRAAGLVDTAAPADDSTHTAQRQRPCARARSSTLAKRLLRGTRADLPNHSPGQSEPTLCNKPLTGDPDAGNPPVRFGGRGGGVIPRSYPYR